MNLQAHVDEAVVRLRTAGTDLADIEVKNAAGGLPKSLPESISAFANGNGGLVLLGLDEHDGFTPTPINPRALADGVADRCRDALEPAVVAEIDIVTVDGSPVVVAVIPPGDRLRMPYYVKTQGMERGSYLRSHDGDRHLTSYEVHALVAGRGQPDDDRRVVPGATLADLDPELVATLVRRLRATRGRIFTEASDAEVLHYVRVLDHEHATLAGLLALGRYPQQFYPQLDITFVVYPTSGGEPMADGTRFLDNASLDGPIPVMIEQTLAAVRRNMTRRAVVVGAGREDRWEYPEEVVRELLGNAVMHRDYHPLTQGSQIRVEMYPDRLVVTSPGGLYGNVSTEVLLHDTVSSSRNAVLAKLLEDVSYPGTARTICENRGTGLLAVSSLTHQAGLDPPEVTARILDFRITLHNRTPGSAALVHHDQRELSQRKHELLSLLSLGPQAVAQLATATGLKPVTVRRHLQELEAAGLVAPTETSRRSPKNSWQRKHPDAPPAPQHEGAETRPRRG